MSSHNFEPPPLIGFDSTSHLQPRVDSAAATLNGAILEQGLKRVQQVATENLMMDGAGQRMLRSLKQLCDVAHRSEPGGTESPQPFHPDSLAAFYGFTVGFTFAEELLKNTGRFVPFMSSRIGPSVAALSRYLPEGSKTLEDHTQLGGSSLREYFRSIGCFALAGGQKSDLMNAAIERISHNFANAVGYLGTAAICELVEFEMQVKNRPLLDTGEEAELYDTLRYIQKPGGNNGRSVLTTAHIPWLHKL